jgi:hypothetical protein
VRRILKIVNRTALIALAGLAATLPIPSSIGAAEYTVYSVYKALDMGNPGEVPLKDYYVNMGKTQGLHDGIILQVSRRVATYDLISEKLYREVMYPIAQLRVIHTEVGASIARFEKFLPVEHTPAISPRAVMVGDIVEIAN